MSLQKLARKLDETARQTAAMVEGIGAAAPMPSTIAAVWRAVSSSLRASFCNDIDHAPPDGSPNDTTLGLRCAWLLKLVRSSLRNGALLWMTTLSGITKTHDFASGECDALRSGRRDGDSPRRLPRRR